MYEGLGDYADFPKAEVLVNVYADFDIKCVLGGTETVGKKKKIKIGCLYKSLLHIYSRAKKEKNTIFS